ncbi:MAG TPA: hypothetical protein VFV78_12835 [Vicinamibacterales bacterium]|nr:hypothetical protein [Vicinamibacterales bacterium]
MRLVYGLTFAAALAMLVPSLGAQGQAQGQGQAMEASRAVAGGGIKVAGWTGKVDANEAAAGMTLDSLKFVAEAGGFHVTTGPATTLWNPANKATGDYTISATFNEPEFMNVNTHPHPYGIAIAGNDLDTPNMSALYCSAYGTGTFIVRGFGPAPFQVSARNPTANDAIHKAEAKGKPVTQDIALSVKGDKIECAINGTVVGSYDKASVVGPGKLKSTDGVYGLRFAHNTDVIVTKFGKK